MGTERRRPRQHIYVSLACVMLFMVAACYSNRHISLVSSSPEPSARADCSHLDGIISFVSQGDFEGAAKASQDIYDWSPNSPPGDEALLSLGLISVHYANPKKDYQKALGYFLRVEREFPTSPLVEEAKTWVGVLKAFEKAKQVDLDIQQKKKELGH